MSHLDLQSLHSTLNQAMHKAAESLNTLLRTSVDVSAPDIQLVQADELERLETLLQQQQAMVHLGFSSMVSGTSVLAFQTDSATRLVKQLAHAPSMNPDEPMIRTAVLTEVGNILLSAVLGDMANQWQRHLLYTCVPTYVEDRLAHVLQQDLNDPHAQIILAHTHLHAPELDINGLLLLLCHPFEAT